MKLSVSILFYVILNLTNGYKILVYNPRFMPSHVSFVGKIADTLADAGHNVTVYQPILKETVTKSGSSNPNIRFVFKKYDGGKLELMKTRDDIWQDDTLEKFFYIATELRNLRKSHCDSVLADHENHELLKKEKFDIAILQASGGCGFGIFEFLGIKKYIIAYSTGITPVINTYLGIPQSAAFVPSLYSSNTEEMSFFQRTGNFIHTLMECYLMDQIVSIGPQKALDEALLKQKIKNAAFLFVNSDELVDFTSPITPKTIYIGALGRTVPSKPLEKRYLDIFNSAKHGVIYLSFGTVVLSQDMPLHLKKIFLEAFSEFPDINFIWKYENENHNIAKDYKNVFTFPFLPQNDILGHPKLLAFITHGGMNSVTESAIKGIPVIAIPMFGDQNHNAKILESKRMGIVLLKHHITKDILVSAIRKIINEETYMKNAKQLSRMVKAKPMTAEERVVKYTEFAAEFGDTEVLQSQGRNLHWIQLHSIDVVAFLLICVFLLFFISYKVLRFVLKNLKKTVNFTSSLKKSN